MLTSSLIIGSKNSRWRGSGGFSAETQFARSNYRGHPRRIMFSLESEIVVRWRSERIFPAPNSTVKMRLVIPGSAFPRQFGLVADSRYRGGQL